ncbi:MAG: DNA methyltransferase [Endomicrobia bacterium]|nr:DNA methyltransferase [Endomicrobiia bacterium]
MIGPYKVNDFYHGDALELLTFIPNNSIDLIITDPPFGIDFKHNMGFYNRKQSNVMYGYKEVRKENYYEFSLKWIKESWRVLKANGSIYIVSGWTNLKDILNAIDNTGFNLINHIIWKYQFGVYTKKKFVTSHYHILYCVKNPKNYTFNKIENYPEDVWIINRDYQPNKVKTPTRLPEKLVEKIILYSSKEGDIILDPFAGSGTVGVCAKKLNRNFICFEIVKEYVELAKYRLTHGDFPKEEKTKKIEEELPLFTK